MNTYTPTLRALELLTIPRHDTAFAVQAISRWAIAYLLTTRGALAPNAIVMSIANQGQSLDDLSVEDLSLKGRLAAGKSATAMFMDQSKRDSTVLDSTFEVRSGGERHSSTFQ